MKRFTSSIFRILTRAEKKRFSTLVALNLLISIADIASLALLVYLVNFYARSSFTGQPGWMPDWMARRDSSWLILLFLLVFSVKNYAGYLIHRAQCHFMARVASRISQQKLLNYLEGNYADYINEDSAAWLRKISFQPLEFCQHILDGFQQIITQSALIVLTIITILLYNATLFLLLLLILIPPVITVFYLLKKRLRTVRANTRASSEKSLQHLQEALAGFVESNIYDKNDFFMHRYITRQQQYNKNLAAYLVVQGTPGRVIEVLALAGLFILIAFSNAGNNSANGIVTLGAFLAAAYKIIPGMVKILNISGQMNAYEFTLKDLAEPAATPAKKTGGITGPVRSVQFKKVGFHYNGQPVLQNLSLQVSAGEMLGIAGASGLGKTTIINLLLGFLNPDSGEILINDQPAGMYQRQQYWKHISYVKQQPFLIHDSILHNIVLDEKHYNEQQLEKAMNASGVREMIQRFPEKLEKIITENGRNISGGQRQRIALARAFYKNTGLVILDEPFNELDEQSEHSILSWLQQLAAKGKIVVLITHNSNSLSYCSKIISLDE